VVPSILLQIVQQLAASLFGGFLLFSVRFEDTSSISPDFKVSLNPQKSIKITNQHVVMINLSP
jgi:hypothetical protein